MGFSEEETREIVEAFEQLGRNLGEKLDKTVQLLENCNERVGRYTESFEQLGRNLGEKLDKTVQLLENCNERVGRYTKSFRVNCDRFAESTRKWRKEMEEERSLDLIPPPLDFQYAGLMADQRQARINEERMRELERGAISAQLKDPISRRIAELRYQHAMDDYVHNPYNAWDF